MVYCTVFESLRNPVAIDNTACKVRVLAIVQGGRPLCLPLADEVSTVQEGLNEFHTLFRTYSSSNIFLQEYSKIICKRSKQERIQSHNR